MNELEFNDIFRFRKFPVYNDAREFRKNLKKHSREHFPKEEQYNLTSQLWRSLDSVVLNIAEGSDKYTGRANSNFLNIAICSLDEVVACIDCALDDGYVSREDQVTFQQAAASIMKQLRALCSATRRSDRSH